MAMNNWISEDIPLGQPSPARMYDYFLGGHHNLEVDRQAAARVLEIYPDAQPSARANRAFLRRVVTYLVETGIDQFLDIGAGIPTVGNVHEIAARGNPNSRVVYVDSDPVAVSHSEALLKKVPNATVIKADARQMDLILKHHQVTGLLDLDKPLAVLLLAVLQFIPEDSEAYPAVATLHEALASGSYLAISHGTQDNIPPEVADQLKKLYAGTTSAAKARSQEEIIEFLKGFDLVDPRLVYVPLWRPEGPDDLFLDQPERSTTFGGVGHKP